MLEQIRQTIRQHEMLVPGDVVVVAVSGGADSCALGHVLWLLCAEYSLTLHWLHVHHGVRGDAASRDAAFVVDLAARWGISCTVGHLHLERVSPRRSGWEALARAARYAQFTATAREVGATRVAMAHHLDDQAETVMMRLLRGTGPKGLGGIPPVRPLNASDPRGPVLIRPLLGVRRTTIEAYCHAQGIPFVVDETNQDRRFLRNRIRRELMPMLSAWNPRAAEHLAALASTMRADNAYLDAAAATALARAGVGLALGAACIPTCSLDGEHPVVARRMLRLAAERIGKPLDYDATERLWAQVHNRIGVPECYPGDLLVTATKTAILFEPMDRQEVSNAAGRGESSPHPGALDRKDTVLALAVPGSTPIPKLGCTVEVSVARHGSSAPGASVLLDPATLPGPLGVRTRRPGDRIWPVGMQGSTKLQDLLVNAKVPREQRDRIPIVVAGDAVIWVVGHRIDRRYLTTDPRLGWRVAVYPWTPAIP